MNRNKYSAILFYAKEPQYIHVCVEKVYLYLGEFMCVSVYEIGQRKYIYIEILLPEKDLSSKTFVCIYCNKHFETRYQLKRHLLTHSGKRQHVCTICQAAFVLSSSLWHHMQTHSTRKNHICVECGQAFLRSTGLRLHRKTHTSSKDHICNICGQAFHQKGNLKAHINAHRGIKPYQCTECGQSYSQLSNMKRHMWTHHQQKKVFSCSLCKAAFEKHKELRIHQQLSHKPATPTVTTSSNHEFHVLQLIPTKSSGRGSPTDWHELLPSITTMACSRSKCDKSQDCSHTDVDRSVSNALLVKSSCSRQNNSEIGQEIKTERPPESEARKSNIGQNEAQGNNNVTRHINNYNIRASGVPVAMDPSLLNQLVSERKVDSCHDRNKKLIQSDNKTHFDDGQKHFSESSTVNDPDCLTSVQDHYLNREMLYCEKSSLFKTERSTKSHYVSVSSTDVEEQANYSISGGDKTIRASGDNDRTLMRSIVSVSSTCATSVTYVMTKTMSVMSETTCAPHMITDVLPTPMLTQTRPLMTCTTHALPHSVSVMSPTVSLPAHTLPQKTPTRHQTTHTSPQTAHSLPQTICIQHQTTHTSPQTAHSLPQTICNQHQTTHTLPQTAHILPQTMCTLHQTTHSLPQTIHTLPQTIHNIPQTTYTLPQTIHTLPQTTQTLPQTSHTLPRTTNSLPQTTYIFPISTQTLPISRGLPIPTHASSSVPQTRTHSVSLTTNVRPVMFTTQSVIRPDLSINIHSLSNIPENMPVTPFVMPVITTHALSSSILGTTDSEPVNTCKHSGIIHNSGMFVHATPFTVHTTSMAVNAKSMMRHAFSTVTISAPSMTPHDPSETIHSSSTVERTLQVPSHADCVINNSTSMPLGTMTVVTQTHFVISSCCPSVTEPNILCVPSQTRAAIPLLQHTIPLYMSVTTRATSTENPLLLNLSGTAAFANCNRIGRNTARPLDTRCLPTITGPVPNHPVPLYAVLDTSTNTSAHHRSNKVSMTAMEAMHLKDVTTIKDAVPSVSLPWSKTGKGFSESDTTFSASGGGSTKCSSDVAVASSSPQPGIGGLVNATIKSGSDACQNDSSVPSSSSACDKMIDTGWSAFHIEHTSVSRIDSFPSSYTVADDNVKSTPNTNNNAMAGPTPSDNIISSISNSEVKPSNSLVMSSLSVTTPRASTSNMTRPSSSNMFSVLCSVNHQATELGSNLPSEYYIDGDIVVPVSVTINGYTSTVFMLACTENQATNCATSGINKGSCIHSSHSSVSWRMTQSRNHPVMSLSSNPVMTSSELSSLPTSKCGRGLPHSVTLSDSPNVTMGTTEVTMVREQSSVAHDVVVNRKQLTQLSSKARHRSVI